MLTRTCAYAEPPYPEVVRRGHVVAVGLSSVVAVGVVIATASVAAHPTGERVATWAFGVLLAVAPCLGALVVVRRSPEPAMAPFLALMGALGGLLILGQLFGDNAWAGHDYLVSASEGSWVLLYLPVALILVLFPNGRCETPAARWLVVAVVVDALAFMVLAAAGPGDYAPPNQHAPHAFGTLPTWLWLILAPSLPLLLVLLVLAVLTLVRRYRRGDEYRRRQIRWLGLAAACLPATLLLCWASYLVFGNADPLVVVGLLATYLAIPAVVTVSLVRPNLFDVDRVISTAAARGALTAGLLVVFTAANLASGLVLPGNSILAAVAVTALSAVALSPLHRRVQRRVDHWLYPARESALHSVSELRRRTTTVQASPEQLEPVLRDALGDSTLLVGLRSPQTGEYVDVTGVPVPASEESVPVVLDGATIGVLAASAATNRELLREVAGAAAPLVEVVRLRLEVREALAEVEQSRTRLLRIGYLERQRLEQDLHDGAQQRLVSLGMSLRLAQRQLERGAVDVHGLLDEAVAQLSTAVSELRQIAHGIRPSCLSDGLGPALASLVGSVPIPVDFEVGVQGLADDVETTAYFVACEAITNVVKHSRATQIVVRVDERQDMLYVRVRDNGVGGAQLRDGAGLSGVADRVGAQGGTLVVDSPGGGGTTVEAVLPCVS